MLPSIEEAEEEAQRWIPHLEEWNSLLVDYHPPVVHRLWRQWGDNRIYLHKIFPCEFDEALMHPHTWPCAIKILRGSQRVLFARNSTNIRPHDMSRTGGVLTAENSYTMEHKNLWHSVQPIDEPSYSIMLTGPVWDREYPYEVPPLKPLPIADQLALQETFELLLGPINCGPKG